MEKKGEHKGGEREINVKEIPKSRGYEKNNEENRNKKEDGKEGKCKEGGRVNEKAKMEYMKRRERQKIRD